MYNFNKLFMYFIILFFLSGCNFTKQIAGEYYLEGKKFDKGYEHFKKNVDKNPKDSSSHFYYARFLLIKKDYKLARYHFEKAISLNSKKSEYYSWLGVSYSKLKLFSKEKDAYLKAISLDKNNLQALTYLAHSYFDSKQYTKALSYYQRVLKLDEYNQSALYNVSLILKKLKRTPEEKHSLKKYLEYYPSGVLARKAVNRLNYYGVFEYKNHIIGIKTITLKQIQFEASSNRLLTQSKSSLDVLANILNNDKKLSIHIVAYQLNNKNLAKEKTKAIKQYILKRYPKIESKRLKLSWFNKSKKFKIYKKKFIEDETIDFITVVKK